MTKTDIYLRESSPLPAAITLAAALIFLAIFDPLMGFLAPFLPQGISHGLIRTTAISVSVFAGANLLLMLLVYRLNRPRKNGRPAPKVLLDLLRVIIFSLAGLITLSLFFRQDLSGILTGSGLVLAVLGFAIRNVVADVFSGLALSIEAPFRIGDWVQVEGLAQGRVLEIGWRTTHLITRDSTYVIVPNSQISRQKITNFSAPRQEYRDFADVTLPAETPIARARGLIGQALEGVPLMVGGKRPEIHVIRYTPEGITYRIRYWVAQHDQEIRCRNEVYIAVDRVLRENGIRLISHPLPFPGETASAQTHPVAAE